MYYCTTIYSANNDRQVSENPEQLISGFSNTPHPIGYEFLNRENNIRPYFDIDCNEGSTETQPQPQAVYEKAMEFVKKMFPQGEFAVSQSNRPSKTSYHIIVSNYVTDIDSLKLLYEQNRAVADQCYIDSKVYRKNNSKFRLLYCFGEKPDSVRKLPVTFPDDPLKHVIQLPSNDCFRFSLTKRQKQEPVIKETAIVHSDEMNAKVEIIRHLLKCLKPERCDSYKDWYNVLCACKNTGDFTWNVFDEWSQGSVSKYDAPKNQSIWDATYVTEQGYNLDYLRQQAQLDNPMQFAKFQDPELMLKNALSGSDQDVATLVAYYARSSLRYCIDSFYRYKNNQWQKVEHEIPLVLEFLEPVLIAKKAELAVRTDERSLALLKSINDLHFKIKQTSTCKNKIPWLKSECNDPEFLNKLDKPNGLIGFNDAVFDLHSKTFRDYCITDYITKSTGMNRKDVEQVTEAQKEKLMIDFINKIMPDPVEREYVLKFFAFSLFGIGSETFHIFSGQGSNGKSRLVDLARKAFGNYAIVANSSIYTCSLKGADIPQPEIRNFDKCRLITMGEIAEHSILQSDTVKRLHSMNSITVRTLHSKPVTFRQTWNSLMEVNQFPTITDKSNGMERRILVNNFTSRFVADQAQVKPEDHIYERDMRWTNESTIAEHAPIFFSILIDMLEPNMPVPTEHMIEQVKQLVGEPKQVFSEFLDGHLVFTGEENDLISHKDIFTTFRSSDEFLELDKDEQKQNNKSATLEMIKRLPKYERYFYHLQHPIKSMQRCKLKSGNPHWLQGFKWN